MTLKNYQRATLDALRQYFERVQRETPEAAYAHVTEDADRILRLGNQRGYRAIEGLADVPVVAIKVPTGGGKTILAAHALKLIAETQGREFPLVLWFAPSDTIRRQTAEALKKPAHPYRQALDAAFRGRVRVFDLDEKFDIRPSDIAQNACVVVATEQAFVKRDTEKYKVYADHEALEPHFAALSLEPGMDASDEDPSRPKTSFANLVVHHRALVIVDEAHKMVSELSQATVSRLRPGSVLGLTATPERGNNTVYSVWAKELFDEQMVKLPIQLREFRSDWTQAVLEAVAKREELQRLADAEHADGADYLRPLVLFQATNVKGEVPVERLRTFLTEEAKCRAEEIAVVTGEQKELDDVDVADPKCPLKYVITVQALKEGWDCPSAYVLCSVANVASNTDTVQLLGRVMRQPQARRRKTNQLNRAYAYVLSSTFGASAEELVNGLRKRGFEQGEAYRAIEVQTEFCGFAADDALFAHAGAVEVGRDVLDAVSTALPESVKVTVEADGSGTIQVSEAISQEDAAAVVRALSAGGYEEKAAEFSRKVVIRRKQALEDVPARTRRAVLPRIGAQVQGELVFDGGSAYDVLSEGIVRHLPPSLADDEFRLVHVGDGFQLFLDGNEMKTRACETPDEPTFAGFRGVLDEAALVNALDALTPSKHLPQAAKRSWFANLVSDLVAVKGYAPELLYGQRFHLKRCVERHLEDAYRQALGESYQQVFGFAEHKYPLFLDFDSGFVLDEGLYADTMSQIEFYRGSWHFRRHFLGSIRVPAFDGQKAFGEGEEFECAKLIDSHPAVEFWLRNVERNGESFSLPLAGGRFYPDFAGELKDGRFFVIEYKGEHLRHHPETVAKDAIGRLWASQSAGKCLYATAYRTSARGLDVRAQLDELFGAK